ncbi:MAG: M48 family metallopeptidase [Cyclobacteriaceae bacterium]|nr:M48 family metallopeptidase [Cyclobacteriaceae bacterium]
MDQQEILYIIIAIVSVSYLFDQFLEYLNLKHQRADIPPEVEGYYDREKYQRSLAYHRDQTRFGFVTAAFGFILTMTMLVTGGFGWVDGWLRSYIEHEVMLALAFFGLIGFASDMLTLPFQWYATFVIEEKYGFNRTTIRTFVLDKLKGYLLAAIIGGGLLAVLIYLVRAIGPNFWIWFALVAAAFIVFMNMFYTSLILPLFNKLTILPDGELKSAIAAFAEKVDFPLGNIYVIDGSKRSRKANAFFSGIGRKKKIVLYDTLIANHSIEELVAVLAHEVGHYKKKHMIWGLLLSILQVTFTLWILSLMIYNQNLSLALGGTQYAIHLNLLAFAILFSPISGIAGLLMTWYSRKNEYEADAFARTHYDGQALANALKKLSVDSLSYLFPHPWYVFFHYSHPPLLKRLESIHA